MPVNRLVTWFDRLDLFHWIIFINLKKKKKVWLHIVNKLESRNVRNYDYVDVALFSYGQMYFMLPSACCLPNNTLQDRQSTKEYKLQDVRDPYFFCSAYLISLSTQLLCAAKMMNVIFFICVNVQSYSPALSIIHPGCTHCN